MRQTFALSLLISALLSAFSAVGQHTVDPGTRKQAAVRPPRNGGDSTHHNDTTRFHYVYTGTGTINNSNSLHSYVLSNALKLSMVKKSAEVNFGNSWVYGKQNSVVTNNDFSSSLDMGLYKTLRHFFYWGVATYNHSVPLQINHQLQTGLGPGYNIVDKKKAELRVTDGVIFEVNDLYDSLYGAPGGNIFRRDRYNTFRNSAHLMFHWVVGDHYTLDGSGFLQNSFAHWNDYILRLSGTAAIQLYKWISFTTSASYSMFSRTRGRNTLVSFGLNITR
ncbi:MAG TPA: DUF481 domain-containing protein [Puia sp.]|nr:DUF481 domain-containing protein [Puia sp.]